MIKNERIFFFIAFLTIITDQSIKYLVRTKINLNGSIEVIKNHFFITHITNSGSSFGMFSGYNLALLIIGIVFVSLIIYNRKEFCIDKLSSFATGLIIGGAIGNILDRILFGHVTDYLNFLFWPVFNMADSCITVGVMILLYLTIKKKE